MLVVFLKKINYYLTCKALYLKNSYVSTATQSSSVKINTLKP